MKIPPPREPIDREEALRLRSQGLFAAEIARRLEYPASSVRRALKDLGERLRPKRSISAARWGGLPPPPRVPALQAPNHDLRALDRLA
jgi:hypothetical protein